MILSSLSISEQVGYMMNPSLRKKIREIGNEIYQQNRLRFTTKEVTDTDVYRKLVPEYLLREDPMEVMELIDSLLESDQLKENIVPAFFINNIMMDPSPEHPLIMYQQQGKTFIALL